MAAFLGIAQTAEVALVAATAKTVLQLITAANHRVKVLRWGVFFDGVSGSAAPVEVALVRQTDAGTMTGLTPQKLDDSLAETLLTTAQHTATAEPTGTIVVDMIECHPQSGFEIIYPLGQEVIIGGGDRLGVVCTAPANVNVRAKIVFEE